MCSRFFLTLLLLGSALLLSAIRTVLKSLAFCVADKLTIVLNLCPGAWLLCKALFTQRGQSALSLLEALQKGVPVLGWYEEPLPRAHPQHRQVPGL